MNHIPLQPNTLDLRNITAVCIDGTIDGNRHDRLVKVISAMKQGITFADILYFSHANQDCGGLCKVVAIPPIRSLNEYSQFIILDLPDYINTSQCMTIHDDGFPINLHLWRDEFTKFDYIGAPWGKSCSPPVPVHLYYNGQVEGGNGGFSIRSKRLMDIGKEIAQSIANPTMREYVSSGGFLHEDGYFCYQIRPQLKERGIRYAPFHISKRFAIESILEDCDNDINGVFGFHAFKHLNFDQALEMLGRGINPQAKV